MRPLRPYQRNAVDRVLQAIKAPGARPILQLPTGAGKTRVAAELIAETLQAGGRAVFIVPYISLIDQTCAALEREGLADIGVMQADHSRRRDGAAVIVASKDTLRARGLRPAARITIVDEAHIKDDFIFDWMTREPTRAFVGLSATPWSGGLGLKGLYTGLIKPVETAKLIEEGTLARPRVFVPATPNLGGVTISKRTGDYDEGELSRVMCDSTIVGSVVDEWLKRGQARPTFVFAVDRAHAKALQVEFNAKGVPAGYVDAGTPRLQRSEIIEQLREGKLKVVVNIRTLVAGVDAPFVSCICYAKPTLSPMEFVQAVGRGLRSAPGKTDCLILDHADATSTHGFIEEIDFPGLDDRPPGRPIKKPERKANRTNLCPACDAANHPDAVECWHCATILKKPTVAVIGGELREARPASHPTRGVEALDHEILGQVQHFAKQKRLSDGWVSHTYRAIAGKWPSPKVRALCTDAHRVPPCPDVALKIADLRRDYLASRNEATRTKTENQRMSAEPSRNVSADVNPRADIINVNDPIFF